jgi:hypothetical protein
MSSNIQVINGKLYSKSQYVKFEQFGTHRYTIDAFAADWRNHGEDGARISLSLHEWCESELVESIGVCITVDEAEQLIKALRSVVKGAKEINEKEA